MAFNLPVDGAIASLFGTLDGSADSMGGTSNGYTEPD